MEDGVAPQLVNKFVASNIIAGVGTYLVALVLILFVDGGNLKRWFKKLATISHSKNRRDGDGTATVGTANGNDEYDGTDIRYRKAARRGGPEPV
jgi:hypothetical protein